MIHLQDLRRFDNQLPEMLARYGPQTVFSDPYIYTLIASVRGHRGYIATSPHDPRLHTMGPYGDARLVHPHFWQPDAVADLTHLNMAGVVQSLAELEIADKADEIEATAEHVAGQIVALRGGRLWTPGAKPEQATLDLVIARRPEGWAALAEAISPPDMLTTEESELKSLADALAALARQILSVPAS